MGWLRKPISKDSATDAMMFVDYAHHEIHNGSHFFVQYSVASLGAMGSPDDMITLSWTTPNTTKWGHLLYSANGSAGWRLRLIEGKTGGGASPTGSITILNSNRNSTATSTAKDLAGTPVANKVSYDATLFTGGTTIWDQYLEGSGGPQSGGVGGGNQRLEVVLKQNTTYQLSLFGTDANPASMTMEWYEHTNRLAL